MNTTKNATEKVARESIVNSQLQGKIYELATSYTEDEITDMLDQMFLHSLDNPSGAVSGTHFMLIRDLKKMVSLIYQNQNIQS